MLTIDSTIEIDAPAELVWRKLAKLDDVPLWVKSVQTAHYGTDQTEGVGAQRVCEVEGLGTLQETITEWEDQQTLTYAVQGMPRLVEHAQNTWNLEQITPERTRVHSRIQLETRYGPFGALFARLMMKPQLAAFMKDALGELRDFVENARTDPEPSLEPVHAHIA